MWLLNSSEDAEGGPYTFRMTPGRVRTLGRGPRADFVLDATLVSRLHCRLLVADGELVVENLGSTNGTYHNGQRVTVSRLRNGDTIGVGRSVLKLDIRV